MIGDRLARLSTGIKMLLILSLALLPLGLIALLASRESANSNRYAREAAVRMMAADSTRRLDAATTAIARDMSAMAVQMGDAPPPAGACRRSLDTLAATQPSGVRLALSTIDGKLICTTTGFSSDAIIPPAPGIGAEAKLVPDARALRITIAQNNLLVTGELPRNTLAQITAPTVDEGATMLQLWQGDASVQLTGSGDIGPLAKTIKVASPVAGGQLALELIANAAPMRAIELLMIALPILMWAAAGLIGWLVMDRLVLRPLARLQHAVSSYSISDGPLKTPAMKTPSHEIRDLAEAFADATARQVTHEAELAEGLARQIRLTREVHHRVKNNLQVVSSLINLHARGARGAEASDAYAAIQRRVDALAVVHRNHYAELEENRGVDPRALIGEIASNLRGTASGDAAGMPVRLEITPSSASQDVAVPVAFLVTEVAEMVMNCDPAGGLTIRLLPTRDPERALLELVADGLKTQACHHHPSFGRFERVAEGLARQLRAPLDRSVDGRLAIEIPIVGQGEPKA
ncbi:Two-component sensor histidine kinase, contains HisKA and HATPase domains [Sphingomonas laterariae]|uniref:histidine kinase n=1 Tax=Edaphosphingomonas laterariae TaxID=861865 RepID=A0A239EJ36_9SPHN|nr:sensor histidine kinase [Sphingomonas laterariae]SNS44685.1 Two-component sensor histidine kinase, contains HisKA and HATPase domains [Sphingomonas laterariae]